MGKNTLWGKIEEEYKAKFSPLTPRELARLKWFKKQYDRLISEIDKEGDRKIKITPLRW